MILIWLQWKQFSNFYVDDCLKSVETEEKANKLQEELRRLLSRGGFHLTKFMSNSMKVLESVPESERALSVKNLDFENPTLERALGVRSLDSISQ